MPKQFKHLILFINTTLLNKISIILSDKVNFKKKEVKTRSDRLLFVIDKILKENKLKIKDIKGIVVVSGPGSFTSVRASAVVGNTLSFVLNIPVVGVTAREFKNDQNLIKIGFKKLEKAKVGKFILPFYEKEPNITKPKKFVF